MCRSVQAATTPRCAFSPVAIRWAPCYDPGRITAGVAQLAERLPCKQGADGSNPSASSTSGDISGGVPKRPNGADCKSVGERLRRFESVPLHQLGLIAG